jgi:hypothetical protein
MGVAGVIKNKGGEFLPTAIDRFKRILSAHADPIGIDETSPLVSWVEKRFPQYVKNEMATPNDPIRALFERDAAHATPAQLQEWNPLLTDEVSSTLWGINRRAEGFPETGMGVSEGARMWENLTDSLLERRPAAEYRGMGYELHPNIGGDTPVYRPYPRGLSDDTGFTHIIDEMRNAIDPTSDIPQHLRIDPAKLERMTVPQAAEHVGKINKWRVDNAGKMQEKYAFNAATIPVKRYDTGFHWANLSGNHGEEALQQALKYEGDRMGHCVGGYCSRVKSGKSQIYSLRDAKGVPHVTIEVERRIPNAHNMSLQEYTEAIQRGDYREHIKQIFGKGNTSPKKEYIPMIQDFIQNGNFDSVEMLYHARMVDVHDAFPADMQDKLLRYFRNKKRYAIPQYITEDEHREILDFIKR